MNIWIINPNATPPSLGGLNRHYYFKKYLEEMGHSVRIFTQGCIYNRNVDFFAKHEKCQVKVVNVDGCDYTFVKVRKPKNILQRLLSIHTFCNIVKRIYKKRFYEIPDIFYLSYGPEIEIGLIFGKLAKKESLKCVIECRDIYPESLNYVKAISQRGMIFRIVYKMVHKALMYANELIFTFPKGKQYLIDKGWASHSNDSIKLDHVHFVPNGLDLNRFNELKKQIFPDSDLNDSNNICLVFTGSIGRGTNYYKLFEIAKRITNPCIKFLIWGAGPKLKKFQNLLRKNKIRNVIYKGVVSNEKIPAILNQSYGTFDLSKFPLTISKYGTSQNKISQYCAAGRPLLISGGINQIGIDIDDSIGVNLDPKPEECARNIDSFITSHPKGSAAYKLVCKHVSSFAYKRDYKLITNMLIKALL